MISPKFGFFEHGNEQLVFLKVVILFYRPIEQPGTVQRKSYDMPLIHKKNQLIRCHVTDVVVVVCV